MCLSKTPFSTTDWELCIEKLWLVFTCFAFNTKLNQSRHRLVQNEPMKYLLLINCLCIYQYRSKNEMLARSNLSRVMYEWNKRRLPDNNLLQHGGFFLPGSRYTEEISINKLAEGNRKLILFQKDNQWTLNYIWNIINKARTFL